MSIYSQTASLAEVQTHFRLRETGYNLAFRQNLFVSSGRAIPLITVSKDYKRELNIGSYGIKQKNGDYNTTLCGQDIPQWHSMMEPPRRCLIPATSFALGGEPTWFCFKDNRPFSLFAMAGVLFRRAGLLRAMVVSVPANRTVSYYSSSMPMILGTNEYACWLHAPWDFASEFVRPYQNKDLLVVNVNMLAEAG